MRTSGWWNSDTPVNIAGAVIRTGDLIHADKHGVCLIPHEVAAKLAEACAEVERASGRSWKCCRSDKFSLEEYIKLRAVTHAKTHE